jgi:hypothetical protein
MKQFWVAAFIVFNCNMAFTQNWELLYKQDSIYILKDNQPFLPYAVTEVSAFSENKAWICRGGKYAYIDTLGNEITDTLFTSVFPFVNGFAIIGIDSLYGVINEKGEKIAPAYYDWINSYVDSIAVAQKDGYWGLLDSAGNEILEPSADEPLVRLKNEHWAMKFKGKWGVLNKDLQIVYPFKYDCILKNGTAYINEQKTKLDL